MTLTDADEGKTVVDQDGKNVGRVVDVRNGDAYVDPDPNVTDTIMSKLGWGDSSEDTYRLDANQVDEITDDEIRLSSF